MRLLVHNPVLTREPSLQQIPSTGTYPNKPRAFAALAVFVIALAWFASSLGGPGLASVYVDPVSRIDSQDEAVYAREAIEMARGGHWMTPTYLGRYVLNKPPMLQWLATASIRAFGISAWALRLPSAIAAALLVAFVFFTVRECHSVLAAIAASMLIASSHLFYVFARFCMTDMLLCLWVTGAMLLMWWDPRLERRASAWLFGFCAGAALLTKGAAGLLPLIALMLHTALGPRGNRPGAVRAFGCAAIAAAVALPWHVYQLATHPQWFIADYVLTQHLSVGVTAPPQYSQENHLVFYARRLFLMDPVLTLAGAAGLVFALWKGRRRPALAAWAFAVAGGLFAFRYRSGYYLLPLLPLLAVAGSYWVARLPRRAQAVVVFALLAGAGVKVAAGAESWGLPAFVASQRSISPPLERYCERRRGNELILVDPNDQFYASALPLPQVRYGLLVPAVPPSPVRPALDYERLGVSLTVAEFNRIGDDIDIYRRRLAAFNLPSVSPVGTLIRATSPREILDLIEARPGADFLLPARLFWSLNYRGPRPVLGAGPQHVFLLGEDVGSNAPGWACRL